MRVLKIKNEQGTVKYDEGYKREITELTKMKKPYNY